MVRISAFERYLLTFVLFVLHRIKGERWLVELSHGVQRMYCNDGDEVSAESDQNAVAKASGNEAKRR